MKFVYIAALASGTNAQRWYDAMKDVLDGNITENIQNTVESFSMSNITDSLSNLTNADNSTNTYASGFAEMMGHLSNHDNFTDFNLNLDELLQID